MDIAITKKKTNSYKYYLLVILLALGTGLTVRYLWLLSRSDLNVDRDTLVFGEVKRGRFTVSVRGSGVLVPDNIQWLSASVDARVKKLAVTAGSVVKKDDLIVELSNPQLNQQLVEARWELEAMEAEVEAQMVAQESALLEQESLVLNAKLNYDSSLLKFDAETELIRQSVGAVSKLTYKRTRLEADQFKQRWLFSQKSLEKMRENLTAQNHARAARLNKFKRTVEHLQRQIEELEVRAPLDSVVLEMPLELGQRIGVGTNITKLAQRDSLIAELQVPEIQISDVTIGQHVTVNTRNSTIEGKVTRVDPAVINGNVLVDVAFTEALPQDARPDLSVDGIIKITEVVNALYVERPLFAQSRGRSTFFRLSDDGRLAERVEVTTGYGSVNQIQIINGLKVGDKIIVSDPSRFEMLSEFHIR